MENSNKNWRAYDYDGGTQFHTRACFGLRFVKQVIPVVTSKQFGGTVTTPAIFSLIIRAHLRYLHCPIA